MVRGHGHGPEGCERILGAGRGAASGESEDLSGGRAVHCGADRQDSEGRAGGEAEAEVSGSGERIFEENRRGAMIILSEKIDKEALLNISVLGETESYFDDIIKCVVY